MDISHFKLRVIRSEATRAYHTRIASSKCPIDIPGTVIMLNPETVAASHALAKGDWLSLLVGGFESGLYVRWDNDYKSSALLSEVKIISTGTIPMYTPIFGNITEEDIEAIFDRRAEYEYTPRTAPRRAIPIPKTATEFMAWPPPSGLPKKKGQYRSYSEAMRNYGGNSHRPRARTLVNSGTRRATYTDEAVPRPRAKAKQVQTSYAYERAPFTTTYVDPHLENTQDYYESKPLNIQMDLPEAITLADIENRTLEESYVNYTGVIGKVDGKVSTGNIVDVTVSTGGVGELGNGNNIVVSTGGSGELGNGDDIG